MSETYFDPTEGVDIDMLVSKVEETEALARRLAEALRYKVKAGHSTDCICAGCEDARAALASARTSGLVK